MMLFNKYVKTTFFQNLLRIFQYYLALEVKENFKQDQDRFLFIEVFGFFYLQT